MEIIFKRFFIVLTLITISSTTFAQSFQKGQFYFHWGWNAAEFTKSDIHFKGSDHDFTLHNVRSKDRQTAFDVTTYFNPLKISIPQYNFKVGYFINDRYDVAFGSDHMKYVVIQDQTVKISGHISGGKYAGDYDNQDIMIAEDFLKLEHTNGLNYVNFEINRNDNLNIFKNISNAKLAFNSIVGFGAGVLIPKTDATLLSKERHDKFHLAGYGLSLKAGLNITIFKRFFIQSELKGGFINMPYIRTTHSKADGAKQNFFFFQRNILFGGRFNLNR